MGTNTNTIVARLRGDSLQLLNGANLTVAGTVDKILDAIQVMVVDYPV